MIYHDSSSPCSIFWEGIPRDTHQISQDPKLQEAVSKLVAAGIIRTGWGHGILPVALHDAPRISRFWMTKFWGNEYGNDWGMQKKWPMNSEFGKKLQLWRGWIIPGIHGIKWHIATFGLDNYDHWADVERTFMSALPLFGQHDSLVLGVCQPASDQLHYYCWIRWFVLIIEQLMVSRLRGGVLTWPSYGADIQTCQDAKPDVRFLIKNRPKWCGKDM